MASPKIPEIDGLKKLTPLEMNSVHFNKRHTVLTPQLMADMRGAKGSTVDTVNVQR